MKRLAKKEIESAYSASVPSHQALGVAQEMPGAVEGLDGDLVGNVDEGESTNSVRFL